jgi:hypothetical protein
VAQAPRPIAEWIDELSVSTASLATLILSLPVFRPWDDYKITPLLLAQTLLIGFSAQK